MKTLAPSAGATVTVRPLATHQELDSCVAMQRRIWGEQYDVVPASLIKVAIRVGGLAAGAFDGRAFVGFVFGITGVEKGAIVHWSHMLAVAPEAQNHGIGHSLKDYQRRYAIQLGARAIYWTFDPLVARNAHFNLNVLGVEVARYVPDMYGESNSPLHRGIGTDRFVVSWPLDDATLAARRHAIARSRGSKGAEIIRMEIPSDISLLQRSDMASARTWREKTRAQLQDALSRGYVVQGFQRSNGGANGFYVLEPKP